MDGLEDEERNVFVRDLLISKYVNIATFAMLVYEYGLTLSDEIRLVWPARLTLPKVLFFINRYIPFVVATLSSYFLIFNTQDDVCRVAWFATGVISFVGYITVESILFARAYAVWGKSRVLIVLLSAVFIGSIVGNFAGSSKYLGGIQIIYIRYFATGCTLRFANRVAWRAFVTLVTSETIAIALLVFKALRHFRYTKGGIMKMMLEDGVLYFIFVMATTVFHLLILRFTNPALCNYLLLSQGCLQSVLCSRLLLRIRGAFQDRQTDLVLDDTLWEVAIGGSHLTESAHTEVFHNNNT